MKRVAIGGLHTECSTYNPLLQSAADFSRTSGDALCGLIPFDFESVGVTPVPIFHYRSVPGGPVARDVYDAQTSEFFAALRDAMPVDGVLLLMHGAMFVPGVEDPEGYFIEQVRQIVGPDALISASFDLHGQMTQRICDNLDAFAAYRTAPHVDVPETHARAARMLCEALAGSPRPQVVWETIPVLASGEMTSTFVPPCDQLYRQLPKMDEIDGICDSNLMIGYVWADSPRATAAAVVTTTAPHAGRKIAADIAASYLAVRDDLSFDMKSLPLSDALELVEGMPFILADSGDNPTAGGVGDRADVVHAVLGRDMSGVLVAGIADPVAFDAIEKGCSRIVIGGSFGGGGPSVALKIDNARIVGENAVVQSKGLTIVITRIRRPFHYLSDFVELGLDVHSYPLLVVKSGYLSPDMRQLPRQQVMALTDGAVCQNLVGIENRHRPDGTWPFDVLKKVNK